MRRLILSLSLAVSAPLSGLAIAALGACDDYGPKVLPHGEVPTTPTTPIDTTPTANDATSSPTSPTDDDAVTSTDTGSVDPTPIEVEPVPVDIGGDHPVVVVPTPVPPQPPTRPRRRMDIDQLDMAIQQATGQAWTQTSGGKEVNQFQALAQTLGKPDFIETTQEDLSASTLFQKFLDEAARTTCDRLTAKEKAGFADGSLTSDTPPILFRYATPSDTYSGAEAAKIDKNLAYLLLRFHGAHVAPEDPAMEPWRWLFQSALHVSPDPKDATVAWRTVCVGLIVHPAFYTY